MQAYVLINCETGAESSVINDMKKLPEVVEINGIWGKYDIFAKIVTETPQEIDTLISKLRNHKDITSTYTMHVLYGQGGTIDE